MSKTTMTNCNPNGDWSMLDTIVKLRDGTLSPSNPCSAITESRNLCNIANPFVLQANDDYFRLPSGEGSDCLCYENMYDLYAACWFCQDETLPSSSADQFFQTSYQEWSANCNQADPNTSPIDKTSWVWKYDATNSTFNMQNAVRAAGGLGSVTEPSRTANTNPAASTSPDAGAIPTGSAASGAADPSSTAASSLGSSKSTNIGAIVGGVIGGLALVGILIFLFFWFTRRGEKGQKGGVAPSAEFARFHRGPTLETRSVPPPLPPQAPGVPYAPLGTGIPGSSAGAMYAPHPGASMGYDSESPSSGPPDEDLPVFHPGHYAGPVFEKGRPVG